MQRLGLWVLGVIGSLVVLLAGIPLARMMSLDDRTRQNEVLSVQLQTTLTPLVQAVTALQQADSTLHQQLRSLDTAQARQEARQEAIQARLDDLLDRLKQDRSPP